MKTKLTKEQIDELILANLLGYQSFKAGLKIPMQNQEFKTLLEGRSFRQFVDGKLPSEPLLLAWYKGYTLANLYG
ncbi:hypothetical protein [Bacteroides sp.]|uniref:hypothetical protein n=1 Tax=Bacteroides sp. TaxID=29523 RepID=UPI00262D5181|nr:hypothetical protein [Bacteroides sp.]MDD3038639.1 hypothetical protein [Bacteroides sp.]